MSHQSNSGIGTTTITFHNYISFHHARSAGNVDAQTFSNYYDTILLRNPYLTTIHKISIKKHPRCRPQCRELGPGTAVIVIDN